jgi:hypothetical protein
MKEISSIGLLVGKYNFIAGIDAFIFTAIKVAQIDRTCGIIVTVKIDKNGL